MSRRLMLSGLSAVCASLLFVWLAKAQLPPPSNPAHPTFRVSPGSSEGAGFGQLSPGNHVLRVTYQWDAADDPDPPNMLAQYFVDLTGSSNWIRESIGTNSRTFVASLWGAPQGTGITEDQMGALYGYGRLKMEAEFNVRLANIRFPCQPLCNGMGCYGSCDESREGEARVIPGGTVTVPVDIHHIGSGKLTITSQTPTLLVEDANGLPIVNVAIPADNSWRHAVPVTIRATPLFSGQGQITCKFALDNGATRDTQDVLIVKKQAPKLHKIIVDASDPQDEGPTGVEVNHSITLRALPNPALAVFDSGEPTWEITDKPIGSIMTASSGGSTIVLTPDVKGSYLIRATAGGETDEFHLFAVEFDKQNLGPTDPASPDF